MFLAVNEILKERSRFILITVVIVLVSYLVFFLTALAYGLATSYTAAIDTWESSGIVLSKSANDNIARSLLFESDYEPILNSDTALLGVGAASIELEESSDVSLFGIDPSGFLLPELATGEKMTADNEVLISNAIEGDVSVGDTVALTGSDTEYKVVGTVEDATFQTAPVIYLTLDGWRAAASDVSGMIGMRDNTTVSAVVTKGAEKPAYSNGQIEWQTIRDFSFALPGYQAQVLTFSLMIGFLIGIAAFVLAIFIYILTMQKKSIFGVLKAEGVPSSYIGRSVMAQVVVLSVFGLVVGLLLAVLTGLLLEGTVPFAVNAVFFVGIAGLFVVCASLGGIASVRSVAKIDPVEAIE